MPLFLIDLEFKATLQVEGKSMVDAATRAWEVRPGLPELPDGVHNLWGDHVTRGTPRRFRNTLPSELPDTPDIRRQLQERHNPIAGKLIDVAHAGGTPVAEWHPHALDTTVEAARDLADLAWAFAAQAEEYRQQVERWAKEK
jgi:hypothetical protein